MLAVKSVAAVVLSIGLAGCSVSTASFNDASGTGGAVVGTLGAPPLAPAPPPASKGAFLEGAVGQKLVDADRDRAFQAELDALSKGQPTTWRGVKGNFGYVTPAASAGPDGCRSFTQKVYIGGRPQTGSGTGCPGPDGSWKITG